MVEICKMRLSIPWFKFTGSKTAPNAAAAGTSDEAGDWHK